MYFCCATALFGDQVILKNGDRITGTIVKKDGGDLVIKSDFFGTVTTKWDQVESVQGDTPVHVVENDGKTIELPVSSVNSMKADVKAIRNADEQRNYERLESPGLTQLWTGTGTVGWAGSAGNAKTLTFTTGLKATRSTRGDKTTLYFNSIKATALVNGVTSGTAEAIRGGFGYDRNFGPRFFLSSFNDYEYDRFQSLDLRYVIGGGFGFHLKKTNRTKIDVLTGGDYNRSVFTTFTRKSAEAYYGDDFEHKIGKSTTMFQTVRVFHDLTNTGQYRVNFDTGASTKVMRWLNWNVSISDRYLNTPSPGLKTNDILYTTGFGISFAR